MIRASSGNSFVHETESQVILNGSYDIGFTMDLAVKDLGFALGLGREHDVPLELATHVAEAFERAREQYGGSAWSSQVVKLLEDELGVDLRAPGFPAQRSLARALAATHARSSHPGTIRTRGSTIQQHPLLAFRAKIAIIRLDGWKPPPASPPCLPHRPCSGSSVCSPTPRAGACSRASTASS